MDSSPSCPTVRSADSAARCCRYCARISTAPRCWQITSEVADVIAQDSKVSLTQPLAPPATPLNEPEEPSFYGIPPQVFIFLIFLLLFGGWRLLAFLLAAADGTAIVAAADTAAAGGWAPWAVTAGEAGVEVVLAAGRLRRVWRWWVGRWRSGRRLVRAGEISHAQRKRSERNWWSASARLPARI